MRARTEQFLPFALLLPSIGFLGLLIVIPMVQALLLAVMAEGGGFSLENFQRMFPRRELQRRVAQHASAPHPHRAAADRARALHGPTHQLALPRAWLLPLRLRDPARDLRSRRGHPVARGLHRTRLSQQHVAERRRDQSTDPLPLV